jgi:hypothetical protein
MFLAVIILCSSVDANSCQLFYNTRQVFLTEEACEKDLEAVLITLPEDPNMVLKSDCILLPGEAT